MRHARIALLAIVVLGVLGIALIAWWTHEWPSESPSAAAPPPVERSAAGAPQPSLAGTRMPADAARPARDEPLAGEADRPPRSEPSARQGASAAKRTSLVSFRREMKAGFAALQRRIASCGAADAWFRLDVETVEGGVRVIDVHLDFHGSTGDANVACARSLLLGETIRVPSAKPGRRWEMSLAPGSAL